MLLEEIVNLSIKHCMKAMNSKTNFIGCLHKLSFPITITLFLFKTPQCFANGQFRAKRQILSQRYRDIALTAASQLLAMVELDLV